MNVHVPKPGDDELAASIDDASSVGKQRLIVRANASDQVTSDHNRTIGLNISRYDVDYRHMSDHGRRLRIAHSTEPQQEHCDKTPTLDLHGNPFQPRRQPVGV